MNTLTTILTVFLWQFAALNPQKNIAPTVLISEVSYKEGTYYFKDRILNGKIVDYYQDKTLKFNSEVIEGKLHGKVTSYYSSGRVKSERDYILGKLFGDFKEYYESGELRTSLSVKLNAFGSGERVENIIIGSLKGKRLKTKRYDHGLIYFIDNQGEVFKSSEDISILNQTSYKITDTEGKRVLLEAK